MADSLVLAQSIELLGGGVTSTLAQCPGAQFRLGPGWDLSAPQPIQDIIAESVLDGERPYGRRSGNRTISLPIVITAPSRAILAGALEVLLQTIDAQTWIMTWTRDPASNASGTPLPVYFDCFRALPATPSYSLPAANQHVAQIAITFEAFPFARSAVPQSLTFASAATGSTPPPSPVVLDNYGTVSGTNFSQSTQHVIGPDSAHWNSGSGGVPSYSKSFGATDITGRSSLSLWIGLGTNSYYAWHQGNVTFTLTIHDNSGHTLNIGLSQYCYASNSTGSPNWQLITATIPTSSSFVYTAVTGYTFTCYNESSWFSGQIMTPDVYLDALTANPVTTGVAASTRGQIYNLFGIQGTARAPLNLQVQQAAVSIAESVTYTTPGPITHIPEAGVTTLTVEKWAGAAAGGSRTTSGQASGSKGGEYTKNTAFACIPGVAISGVVGAGGVASATAPTDGGDTWFGADDSTAAHGSVAPAVNTTGAVNTAHGTSTDPTHFAGGAPAGGATTGGGGGESGGPSGAGNAGGNPAGGTGNANAGDGGAGGAAGVHAGSNGIAPGGGAGGASTTGATTLGGNGAAGQIKVSWTRVLVPFETLIAHRPGPDAPQNLSPFVSVGNGSDTPNNGTVYAVPSLVAGTTADFGSTYSIVLTNFSWSSPSSSRTVTVTVNEIEYTGGPSYAYSVARTFTPSTDITNGIVLMGELTLPGKDIAPDNTTAYYTVTINDTITADRFLDVLFLDTMGETVMIDSSTGYVNYFIDEPGTDRDIGRVLGSAYDRGSAISVLDQCMSVSGGPLTVVPGDQILLMYCIEGSPAIVASYNPRWQLDRLS